MYECLYPAGTHSLAHFLVRLFTQLRALFNRAVNAKSLWADRPSWRWDEGLIHWEGGNVHVTRHAARVVQTLLGPPFPTRRMSTSSYRNSPHGSDTRKRQSRRDEAIRKRIETELSRKTGKPSTPQPGRRRNQVQAGTVSALRPLPALTVPQTMSITDASQLCAAKRTDCVLVVDDEEHLAGIFTAKDLAYRIVAGGIDPRMTPVSSIMTVSPMVTRDTTSATEALSTMVTRGFRHLPVCNEDGDVVGLLDIAKVFYEALEKLERAHGSSQKLYHALEGVQNEWGGGPQQAMMQYVQSLRERMSMPELASILDSRTMPCTVGVRTTVRDAARLMKQHRTTAVCVMENASGTQGERGIATGKIAGIFTSKDVVLRVIAAGLDPERCSVVRVMTPHPDTASPSLSIQEALRKMHDGRYLNLPVVDVDARLVGVVDVLKLTYATLEQINSMNSGDESDGGPMWNRFWNSFGQGTGSAFGEESMSAMSGSQRIGNDSLMSPPAPGCVDLSSDVHPNDSASAVGESTHEGGSALGGSAPFETDDGTYLFKFVTPSGRVHRFQARYDSFDIIHEIVLIKLSSDPFFAKPSNTQIVEPVEPVRSELDEDGRLPLQIFTPPMPSGTQVNPPDVRDFTLAFKDDDDDLVLMTSDSDVCDSVKVARHQGRDRVLLVLQGGKTWDEAVARDGLYGDYATASSATAANRRRQRELADAQVQRAENASVNHRASPSGTHEPLFGIIPRDMALPAAIGFASVAGIAAACIMKFGRL